MTDWMGSGTETLTGFSWRAGRKRDTTGIIMWSDIFLHTKKTTGDEIAIVVMDTQGLFDNETQAAENSKNFAITTLISSIQILNLSKLIQEDQLQYLQFATEFAKYVAQNSQETSVTPFQNLIFLIRDWEDDELELGAEGGAEYLKEVLEVKGQKPELKSVRESISASFETVKCLLMSYPGIDVAGTKNYNGQWSLMHEKFKDVLKIIIEELLDPENLILKKINGEYLTGFELKEYIKSLSPLFQSETLPPAKSIYELLIDRQMSVLIDNCLDFYKKNIAQNEDELTEDNLELIHGHCASKTLILFKDEKKMGNSGHEKKYQDQLEAAMNKLYTEWHDQTIKSLQQIRKHKLEAENDATKMKSDHKKQMRKQAFFQFIVQTLATSAVPLISQNMRANTELELSKQALALMSQRLNAVLAKDMLTKSLDLFLLFLGKR